MMMYLNNRCQNCSQSELVTVAPNGKKLRREDWYYRCMAGAEAECFGAVELDEEPVKSDRTLDPVTQTLASVECEEYRYFATIINY